MCKIKWTRYVSWDVFDSDSPGCTPLNEFNVFAYHNLYVIEDMLRRWG